MREVSHGYTSLSAIRHILICLESSSKSSISVIVESKFVIFCTQILR